MDKQIVAFSDNSWHGILYSTAKDKYCYTEKPGWISRSLCFEQKLGRRKPILHGSIYTKFKERQDYSTMMADVGRVITSGEGADGARAQWGLLGFWKRGSLSEWCSQARMHMWKFTKHTFQIKINVFDTIRKKEGKSGRKNEEGKKEEKKGGRKETEKKKEDFGHSIIILPTSRGPYLKPVRVARSSK